MERRQHLLLLAGIAGLLVFPAEPVPGSVWEVHVDGSGDVATIQDAVQAAAGGDTILVGPGSYNESVEISAKGLTLRSVSGPHATFLDPSTSGRALLLDSTGSTVIVEGFTLTRGRASGDETDNAGGAIAAHVSPLVINNCRFLQNTADGTGGAVYATLFPRPGSGSAGGVLSLSVTGCSFEGNFAGSDGGALYACEVPATVVACTFQGNTAVLGGAVGLLHQNHVVHDSDFLNNTALSGGGLSFIGNGSVRVEDSGFLENVATNYGGGVHAVGGISFQLERCVFRGNRGRDGGGSALIRTPLSAHRVFWHDNAATRRAGGILLDEPGTTDLTRCTWLENTAPVGRSISVHAGMLELQGCLIGDDDLAVDCSSATVSGDCNAGGLHTAGCLALVEDRFSVAACPEDDGALCPLPASEPCGTIGHADIPCADCRPTPVARTTWGGLKDKYTRP